MRLYLLHRSHSRLLFDERLLNFLLPIKHKQQKVHRQWLKASFMQRDWRYHLVIFTIQSLAACQLATMFRRLDNSLL